MRPRFDCRDAFSAALEELAACNGRVVAVVNDAVGSTKLSGFLKRFPDRFVNVGIAEQNMVGIGAGLANAGKVAFVCGASCFLTGRALEQVKVDLAYSSYPVKLCGMASGFAYGQLGATHHSIEDLAWTRAIPGLTVIVPADAIETAACVRVLPDLDGPVFLRLSRTPVPNVHAQEHRFELGQAVQLRKGGDVTLIAIGVMVYRALKAADLLREDGVKARVLNMSSLKPIDEEAILAAARETAGIVTAEEHNVRGGLGGAVAEVVVAGHPCPMRILGVPDTFAPTGPPVWLLEHFRLTSAAIRNAALELVGRKAAK